MKIYENHEPVQHIHQPNPSHLFRLMSKFSCSTQALLSTYQPRSTKKRSDQVRPRSAGRTCPSTVWHAYHGFSPHHRCEHPPPPVLTETLKLDIEKGPASRQPAVASPSCSGRLLVSTCQPDCPSCRSQSTESPKSKFFSV